MSKTQQINARELISRTAARSPEFFVTYAEIAKLPDKSAVRADSLPLFTHLSEEERAAIYTLIRRSQGDMPEDLPHRKLLARRLFFLLSTNRKVYRLSRAEYRMRTVEAFADYWANNANAVARCRTRIELMHSIGSFLKCAEARYLSVKQEVVRKANTKPLAKLLDLYTCSGELEFNEVKSRKAGKLGAQRGDFWDLGRDGGGQHELRFRITSTLPRAAVSIVQSLGQITRNGGHIHMNCKGDEAIGERVFHALRYHLKWFQWLCPMVRRSNRFCHVENVSLKFAEAKNDNKYAAIAANTWDRTGTVEVRVWPASIDAGDWTGRAALMRGIAKWSERTPEYFTDASLGGQGIYEVGSVGSDTAVNERENFLELAEWMSEHDAATLRWIVSEMRHKAKGEPARNGRVDQEGVTRCYDLVRAYEDSDLRKPVGFRRMREPAWVSAGFAQPSEAPDSSTTRRRGMAANRNPGVAGRNPMLAAGCTIMDDGVVPPSGVYVRRHLEELIREGQLGRDLNDTRPSYDELVEFIQAVGPERGFCCPNRYEYWTSGWDRGDTEHVYIHLGIWPPRSTGTRRGNTSVGHIIPTRPIGGGSYHIGERASVAANVLLPPISLYAEADIIVQEVTREGSFWIVENGEWHTTTVMDHCSRPTRFARLNRAYTSPLFRERMSTTYLVG